MQEGSPPLKYADVFAEEDNTDIAADVFIDADTWFLGLPVLAGNVTPLPSVCSMKLSGDEDAGLKVSCTNSTAAACLSAREHPGMSMWHTAMQVSITTEIIPSMSRKHLYMGPFSEKRRKYTSKNQNAKSQNRTGVYENASIIVSHAVGSDEFFRLLCGDDRDGAVTGLGREGGIFDDTPSGQVW